MAPNESEKRDEVVEKQIRLVQRGIRYGLIIAFGGALLCILLMFPVFMLLGESTEGFPDAQSFVTTIFIVSMLVPLGGIGILGLALYKLVPLYIRYRRSRQPDEEMFP
jgi:ABC-type Na+ efflux pump permease subunit